MFRKSLRLLNNDWVKFFVQDRHMEPDLYRGLKEIGDLGNLIHYIEVKST